MHKTVTANPFASLLPKNKGQYYVVLFSVLFCFLFSTVACSVSNARPDSYSKTLLLSLTGLYVNYSVAYSSDICTQVTIVALEYSQCVEMRIGANYFKNS